MQTKKNNKYINKITTIICRLQLDLNTQQVKYVILKIFSKYTKLNSNASNFNSRLRNLN